MLVLQWNFLVQAPPINPGFSHWSMITDQTKNLPRPGSPYQHILKIPRNIFFQPLGN